MSKQRRNRRPTPEPLATGETLSHWQSNPADIKFAQQDPTFRRIITVLTNERLAAITRVPVALKSFSESYLLGVTQGYEAALTTMQLMTRGPDPVPPREPEATYDSVEKEFDSLSSNP